MKPNTRILDYTTLVQDGVLALGDVPQDIKSAVTKWVRYLSGVEDHSMVKDTAVEKPVVDTKALATTIEDQTKKVLNNVSGSIN